MEFIDVTWRHNTESDPVRLVSELDEQRYETRKLEFYSDGRVGFASSASSSQGTMLAAVPVPPLFEINSDPQFSGSTIGATQFEVLWVGTACESHLTTAWSTRAVRARLANSFALLAHGSFAELGIKEKHCGRQAK